MIRSPVTAAVVLIVLGAIEYFALQPARAQGAVTPALSKLPSGYRDWRLISVAHEEGKQNDIRAILGNDIAIKAFRDGTLPFPDGAMIAAVHWNEASSTADDGALAAGFPGAGLHSTFAGAAVNVQFMV